MKRLRYFPEQLGVPGVRELVEVYFDAASEPLPVHVHPDAMELCFLVSGSQAYTVQGKAYPIRGGEMFLTYPNEEHQGATPFQERCRLYYMIVDTTHNRSGFLGFPGGECAGLACELEGIASRVFFAGERVQALFEDCFAHAAALTAEPAHALERASLRAGLLFLLQAIVRQSRNGTPAYSPPIAGVLAYFEEHLDERVLLRDAAQHTGMSLEQLKRRFRREVGIPPADYLLRRKVQAACAMLEAGESVTQTAFQLGFSSSQHFSRVFKQYLGFPPSHFAGKGTRRK